MIRLTLRSHTGDDAVSLVASGRTVDEVMAALRTGNRTASPSTPHPAPSTREAHAR